MIGEGKSMFCGRRGLVTIGPGVAMLLVLAGFGWLLSFILLKASGGSFNRPDLRPLVDVTTSAALKFREGGALRVLSSGDSSRADNREVGLLADSSGIIGIRCIVAFCSGKDYNSNFGTFLDIEFVLIDFA